MAEIDADASVRKRQFDPQRGRNADQGSSVHHDVYPRAPSWSAPVMATAHLRRPTSFLLGHPPKGGLPSSCLVVLAAGRCPRSAHLIGVLDGNLSALSC
jgi:hypothetical protein